MKTSGRVVNIRYKVMGLNFDAAVDCDWFLHAYCEEEGEHVTPIELYCLDRKDWDVRMIYQNNRNDQQRGHFVDGIILHSFVDFAVIVKETKKWIKENTKR